MRRAGRGGAGRAAPFPVPARLQRAGASGPAPRALQPAGCAAGGGPAAGSARSHPTRQASPAPARRGGSAQHKPTRTPPPLPPTTCRFDVPNHRLRAWNEGVQRQLLQRPAEYLPGFQDAIRDFIAGLDATRSLVKDTEIFVGISGEFGDLELSPRELSSGQLGRLVKVYGIVTKCSLVRPKLVTSVHYCPESKLTLKREYRDVTALVGLPTGARARRRGPRWRAAVCRPAGLGRRSPWAAEAVDRRQACAAPPASSRAAAHLTHPVNGPPGATYPTRDQDGHLLVTEYGKCRYRDNQMITMQELPETAPPGQLPHSGARSCGARSCGGVGSGAAWREPALHSAARRIPPPPPPAPPIIPLTP
jgi:hypothetical protein